MVTTTPDGQPVQIAVDPQTGEPLALPGPGELDQKIDSVSAEIDRCLVNSAVEYTAPFDVNDALFAVFEAFTAKETA